MARIRIKDLPKDMKISNEELKRIRGGSDLLQTAVLDPQLDSSLQYLQLQQNMQMENRQFTLISNILKTKHDTAKNAINNVR